jgi:uncharacterized repeat protein (TIGR01451 family)
LGLVYTFTATVTPTNSTKPIKYTWEATEQVGSTSDKNTITATQNYSWTTPGLKAITVTAKNLGSTVVATHKITIGLADLMVTGLDTPDPVALGGNISYLITVTNKGPLTATGIIITDTLPQEFFSASLVLNENQPTVPPENGCTLVGNLFICKRNTPLPSGASFSLSLALAPQSTGLLTNHIEVMAQEFDPNPANNQADVATTVGAAFVDVAVSQSASSTSTLVGQPLTYTLEIRNNGQAEALGVSLTDQLPAGVLVTQWSATPGLNCASPTTMVSCSLGQLPVGVPATITLVVVPGEAGPLTNTVTGVASVGQDTTPADNIHILVVKALYQRYLPLILTGN